MKKFFPRSVLSHPLWWYVALVFVLLTGVHGSGYVKAYPSDPMTFSDRPGWTHLAIALGLLTAEAGHRIYFTTAIEMTQGYRESEQIVERAAIGSETTWTDNRSETGDCRRRTRSLESLAAGVWHDPRITLLGAQDGQRAQLPAGAPTSQSQREIA